tara:strand:+ start:363 stop:578 length:216 start_codon:yes stop_codon:yes gene_type:complete
MYRDNNLYLLVRAANLLEKQRIINSFGWKRKRYYLKRERASNCGKKKQELSSINDIIYRCHDCPDLFLVGI